MASEQSVTFDPHTTGGVPSSTIPADSISHNSTTVDTPSYTLPAADAPHPLPAADSPLPANAFPAGDFYTVRADTSPLLEHLDTRIDELPPETKDLLARWSARWSTKLDGKQFNTLNYAVRILQTHQPDPQSTVCPLLAELSDEGTTPERMIELYNMVHGGLQDLYGGGSNRSAPTTASSSVQSSAMGRASRSWTVKQRCRARDGDKSVLTKLPRSGGLEVAHIIPRSVGTGENDRFWPFMEMFLQQDRVTALRSVVLGPQGTTDHLRNVMLLDRMAHNLFDTHKLELVPVLQPEVPFDSTTCLTYQARVGLHGKRRVGLVCYVETSEGVETGDQIADGYIITLTTNDALRLPLPHPLLLQLHSICSRIMYLKAGAGYPETEPEDSDGESVWEYLAEDDLCQGEALEYDSWAPKLRGVPQLGKKELFERWRGPVSPPPFPVRIDGENLSLENERAMVEGEADQRPEEANRTQEQRQTPEAHERAEDVGEVQAEIMGPVEPVRGAVDHRGQLQSPTPATSTNASRVRRKRKSDQVQEGGSLRSQEADTHWEKARSKRWYQGATEST